MSSRSSNNSEELICVGWIRSAHGLSGEINVQLFAKQADWLDRVREFHLEPPAGGGRTTYVVQAARPHKGGLLVRLEGVPTRTEAEAITKYKVYIPTSCLKAAPGERLFLHEILGFQVLERGTPVGPITGFASNGPQDLLRVKRQDGVEVLIPLVDPFILNIDFDKKELNLDLPSGLVYPEEE